MEPLAHVSVGLIAKPFAPKAPIRALLAATAVPDLLSFGLLDFITRDRTTARATG